jgi:hypothetical protein
MAENEVIFRQQNEKVLKSLTELEEMAKETGHMGYDLDIMLQFYCECSDENCRERIALMPDTYKEIHKKRDRFIILPRHRAVSIEDVVLETPEYHVVKKHDLPPEKALGLHATAIDNVGK